MLGLLGCVFIVVGLLSVAASVGWSAYQYYDQKEENAKLRTENQGELDKQLRTAKFSSTAQGNQFLQQAGKGTLTARLDTIDLERQKQNYFHYGNPVA